MLGAQKSMFRILFARQTDVHDKLFLAPIVDWLAGQPTKRLYLRPLKTLGANLAVLAVIPVTISKL